jgi:CDP-paratose 2-epimerase
MKVLVTGGCGFLGSNICLFYKEKGAEVIAYDNLAKHEFSRNPYMKDEARDYNKNLLEKNEIKVLVKDIRNKNDLLEATKGCDYICHTAAQPAMTISWENPELDFSTNTRGTFNVLEVARELNIPVAICSSVHTYGPDLINSQLKEEKTRYVRNPISINEDEPLLQGMVTPLHASKRSNEIYAQAYIDTFKMKVACFRLTGIYGENQFGGEDHGWVANFSIRAEIGLPLTIFGTGKQLRDILYASDVAEAFDAFYKKQIPGIYTLGGGELNMISLLECIEYIKGKVKKDVKVNFEKERPGDLHYFVADHSKFTKATGWKPKVKPQEGIMKLLSWVKENGNLFKQ